MTYLCRRMTFQDCIFLLIRGITGYDPAVHSAAWQPPGQGNIMEQQDRRNWKAFMNELKQDPNKHKRNIAIALIVAGIAAGSWLLSSSDEEQTKPERRLPVEVVSVQTRDLQETVRGIGTLGARAEVVITAETAGRVAALHFDEGSPVVKDDVLIELDARKARSQLAAREAALEAARVRVANLERSFNRQQRLLEQSLVSEEQFEQVRTELDSVRAERDRLEAEVVFGREQLKDTVIRAPFSGTISERRVDPGAYITPGQSLATLYQLDPLEFSFSLPERYAGIIADGQPVEVTTAAFPNRSFVGELSFISPNVDESTRTLRVKARVPNPQHELKPGAFATALVTVGTRVDRPVVPSEALVATRSGYMLFVVEEGIALSRAVEIGLRYEDEVEITSGLQVGELVVRAGHMRLDSGVAVNIINESFSNHP